MHKGQPTLQYQRARFTAQLPTAYRYSRFHFWLGRQDEQTWRIGLTKYGARLFGEMVDYGFEVSPQAPVACGQLLGWLEGFKAIADIISVAEGRFAGVNPALEQDLTLINQDPHGAGWLYAIQGQPDAACMDVAGYAEVLDRAIDDIVNSP